MFVCIRLIVDDSVLLVHTAGLNHNKIQSITVIHANLSTSHNNPAVTPNDRAVNCTCSMSSQSSLPTKIISLGRRCRVPELLTRNHDVTLIFTVLLGNPRASWENTGQTGEKCEAETCRDLQTLSDPFWCCLALFRPDINITS